MKNKKVYKLLLIIGLLFVSLDLILKRTVIHSDILNGLMMGFGIGLEITAIIFLKKRQNSI